MNEKITVSRLLEFYGALITEKQATALSMYHNMDLSLAEVAENMDITRQGARDLIKKGEAHLREFETTLGMVKRFDGILAITDKIKNLSDKTGDKELSDMAYQITEILEL